MADRQIAASGIGYDAHQNQVLHDGDTYRYDQADRHLATVVSGVRQVALTRDALDRVVARTDTDLATNTTSTTRYGFAGGGDVVSGVYDTSNNLLETTVALAGGVLYTKRAGGTDVWSYPNVHGDIAATRVNSTVTMFNWDPYGNPVGNIPDNSAGSSDWGWLGQHQRTLDHATGLNPIIEMGARVYQPDTGRFQQTDPIEDGTTTNPYSYVPDPINQYDLDGEFCGWGCMKKKLAKVGRAVGGGAWRVNRWVSRRVDLNVSGCLVGCVGLGFQGGTIYRQSGIGCCFVGANAGLAVREYGDRACVSVVITAGAGPSGSATQGMQWPLRPSVGDLEVGVGGGWGGGVGVMRNFDLIGPRTCG